MFLVSKLVSKTVRRSHRAIGPGWWVTSCQISPVDLDPAPGLHRAVYRHLVGST